MQVGREGRATVKAQANALIPGGLVASGIMLERQGYRGNSRGTGKRK